MSSIVFIIRLTNGENLMDEINNNSPTGNDESVQRTRRIVDVGNSGTRRIIDLAQLPADMPLGAVAPGVLLCGKYTVERTLYPHETQRPGLFLCQGEQGKVVIKIAASFFPPKLELWQRLPFLHNQHILQTFQIIEESGRYFEVQEFCPGGSLADRIAAYRQSGDFASPTWLCDYVVPQMCQALDYLHGQDIIHRDVKPANIYLKRAENGTELLVLGDFDISAMLEQSHTSRDTERLAGSWLYSAPEAFPRFIDDNAGKRTGRVTRASDYYSLGVTLIELLLGTTSLQQCQLADLFDFYLQGGRLEIPQGIPANLSLLLRGLLIRNRHNRWGSDEIGRWLEGSNTNLDLQAIADDEYYELARGSRPYRLNEKMAVDLPGLAEIMFQEQGAATEDLITADVLLNWIGNINSNLARELRRDRDENYLSPALVLFQAIYRCDPTRPYIFEDGEEVESVEKWINHALLMPARSKVSPSAWLTNSILQHLAGWLRCKEVAQQDLALRVLRLQASAIDIRFEELVYLLQPTRAFPVTRQQSAETPRSIATIAYGETDDWQAGEIPGCYRAALQRWRSGALDGWLRQRGMEAIALESEKLRLQTTDTDDYAAFETLLRLLDPQLPPVKAAFDPAEISLLRTIPYGKKRSFQLSYRALGAGIPIGALQLSEPRASVQLSKYLLNGRSGVIEVNIDARLEERAMKTVAVPVEMKSAIAVMQPEVLTIRFRVEYSMSLVLQRLLAGATIGAAALGLPRFLLYCFGESIPLLRTGHGLTRIWPNTIAGQFPLIFFIISLLLLAASCFFASRLWWMVYRRSDI